jgi:DNA replication protein DnaC
MSAPTLTRELVLAQAHALKLPGVARGFEGLARQARDAHWPHEDYLHEVLNAEQTSRHESVMRQRLREARFPEVKTLDTFDFAAAEGVNATQLHTLARSEWVTAPENLIFAGPIGTGKTHLAIALGVEATKQKRRVLFTRAADLVRQLLEARDARELTRLQQRLFRVDVLIVDELGLRALRPHRRGAALQSDHRSLRTPGDRGHHESCVCRMGHRVCRRRETHDGTARPPRPSRDRHHDKGEKLSHAQTAVTRRMTLIARSRPDQILQ